MKNLKLTVFQIAVGSILAVGSMLIVNSCNKFIGPEGPQGPSGVAISAEDQAAFDAADGLLGGRAYDHVISQDGITDTSISNHPDFYRCKSCHGWDYRGRNGVLIDHAPSATYPVAADDDLYMYAKSHNIKEIFDAVKHTGGRKKMGVSIDNSFNGTMPDYGLLLTDAEIWDLVKFLKNEAHNVFDFYDYSTTGVYPTGTLTFSNIGKGGDAAAGLVAYNANCKSCHGADGTQILIYCGDEYMGDMFRKGPEEVQHKAKVGMPNDIDHVSCQYYNQGMPVFYPTVTDQNIRDMLVMGQDSVAFPGY